MRTLILVVMVVLFACIGAFSATMALTQPLIGVPLFAVVLGTAWDFGRFVADYGSESE